MRIAVLFALTLVACGGSSAQTPRAATPAATASPTAAAPTVAAGEQAACASLYARLQRVSVALSSSSELIVQSADPQDLSRRIATEQQQLERSAKLMDAAVVPKPLVAANRRLVQALRRYARDFEDAKAPARRGDFQAAVEAMTDKAAVDSVAAAAKTIEQTCGP